MRLLADGVLVRRLAGRREVGHQLLHDVGIARLLEVGHHHVLGIGLGIGAGLAHQAGGPEAQQLVAARVDLELQLLVMLVLGFEGFLAIVEGGHRPLRLGLSRRGGI
jgi:hypothetical protein